MSTSTLAQGSDSFNYRGWQLVRRQVTSQSPAGTQYEIVYEGIATNIEALANTMRARGAKVSYDVGAGKCTLRALFAYDPGTFGSDPTSGDPSSSEVPTETYELTYDEIEYSIFAHPFAVAESKKYVSASQYKAYLEGAIRDGKDFPLDSGKYPFAKYMWENYLTRGVDAWKSHRPVITWNRSYTIAYDQRATPNKIAYTSNVYTRAKLISLFGFDANFAVRVPADPLATEIPLPDKTVWGWRWSGYHFGYDRQTARMTESFQFQFNAWSTGLYSIIA